MVKFPIIWLAELGGDVQSFGPDDPVTQEVANDPAVAQFFALWEEAGYPASFEWEHTIDNRSDELPLLERVVMGFKTLARENAEMVLSLVFPATVESRVDAVGGLLGSLDKIAVMEVAPGISRIEVINDMGLRSLTRVPGRHFSLLPDLPRRTLGVAGTVRFRFFWYVETR
jgi:hypothetical protein